MKTLRLCCFLLLQFSGSYTFAQENWRLSEEMEGVKIYTRPIPNSKINAIKVEFNIQATPAQLIALLMDIGHSNEWLYHCKSSRIIKTVSPNEFYYYTEVNVPWPVQNRDFVSHLMLQQDSKTGIITINAPAVNGMVPVKDNIVRITRSSSKWTIFPLSSGSTKVNYELEVDPQGSIPSWLVNLFAKQGPVESYKKLKIQVEKPAYKKADWPGISSKAYND